MRVLRHLCLVLILLAPALVAAQDADKAAAEAAKEKLRLQGVIVEQVLGEIPNLRLSENRSFVFAKAGNIVWVTDPRQGRALFQNAIGEMLNALQSIGTAKKNDPYQNEILTGQATRPQILNIIAARDAELALEALYKTRPPMVAEALLFRPGKYAKISNNSNNYGYIAQNELGLEQTLARMAAEQNPERAAKLLKESLQKGLSQETFSLLSKLFEKDPAAADELTASIVDKLVKNKFMSGNQPDHQGLNIANAFLNNFMQERPANTKFVASDPSQMRSLAERLIAFYLEPTQHNYGYHLPPIIKFAEKLVPGAVARLKQAQAENLRRGNGDEHYEAVNTLLNSESTPENLIAEAAKYPINSRGRIFETAASKFAQQGNTERARQILEENFSDDALENALANINSRQISDLQNQGRFAEAERLIDGLPENNRMWALINLANAAFEKNREENRAYAVAVLTKARSEIADRPENSTEMAKLLQIVSAFSNIDPDEAFGSFAGLVPQINEITDASVVVYGFQGNSSVRQGEMMMAHGNSLLGFHLDQSIFSKLAEKDMSKTMGLIDGFTRRETRILLKLQLAETGLGNLPVSGRQFRNFSRRQVMTFF